MKKGKILFLAISVSIFMLFSLTATPESALDPNLRKALNTFDSFLPYELVKIMASPEMAGRLTGDEGYTKAAKWAASKFKEWGLRPLDSRQGYLQSYPSPYTIIDKAEMSLNLASPGPAGKIEFKEIKLTPASDFLPLLFSASGQKTGDLVFVGWGISAPELNYDDYAGVEVKGKFVLCFRGTPDPGRSEFQYHDEHRTRMKVAKEKGALGLIYIYPEVLANPNGDWLDDFLPGMISEKTADLIFKEINSSSAELRKALETYKRPISFPLKSKLTYSVSSRHNPNGVGYNVCGWVEGSDPKLKKELIVVGAHFDHCGQHLGMLFPGANDNASGSATIMAIAKAFASLKQKPKRSVMFVLFGGEEMGLQGSTYFAQNLPAGFDKVSAMFNYDMTGEGDGANCGLSAEPPELKEVLERANKEINIINSMRVIRQVGVRSSDFAPFFRRGIPVASFSSNGPHLAYHQSGDTIFRINPEIMTKIAQVSFLAIYFWANR